MGINKVEIQDDKGNIYYPHTDASVVKCGDSDVGTQLADIKQQIKNEAIVKPSVSYGMNNVIKNTGNVSISPKFTIQGKTVINLLGKDGNCEDASSSVWGVWQCVTTTDTANKKFGTCSIKVTATNTMGNMTKNLLNVIDKTKYYCFSAYIKNIDMPNGAGVALEASGDTFKSGNLVKDTTNFVRSFVKIQPSDMDAATAILFHPVNFTSSASGKSCYVDGVMLEEITQVQYNDANFTPSSYVDSYACLQNPYIEVRHDNLIRNGNCEEGNAWWLPQGTPNMIVDNGYFKLTDDSTVINEGIGQYVNVKAGATYSVSVTAKCGTCSAAKVALLLNEGGLDDVQTGRVDVVTTSTSDAVLTGSITIPDGYPRIRVFLGADGGSSTGTMYFKNIILVESNTPSTVYKPCRLERVVLETKLTSDDSITYENGKVAGKIWWKHKTLYGKDYDWQFNSDATGYKEIRLLVNGQLGSESGYNEIGVKYDGKMLINQDTGIFTSSDRINGGYNGEYWLSAADSDSGWAENINPNNDEVKAFMNGWKATSVNMIVNRYVFWQSIIDNSIPSIVPQTTVATAYSGGTSLTVADGSKFNAGEFVLITNSNMTYQYVLVSISSISGNVLTLSGSGPAIPVGSIVVRADNGSNDTRLLNYCKNNIAPNYEGYQLHYKLQNPEPVTDDNCHIHGDIPVFNSGDNYLYLDSGIVLDEVANPVATDGGVNMYINDAFYANDSRFKNKLELFLMIYKNNLNDINNWNIISHSVAYGNLMAGRTAASFDPSATYTVDYKTLSTIAPQIGLMSCSYNKDIINAVNDLQEEMNSKQVHDSILDEIVDLSVYEQFLQGSSEWWYDGAWLYVQFNVNFAVPKRACPTLSNIIPYISTMGNEYTKKFTLDGIWMEPFMSSLKTSVIIKYHTADSTVISNIKANGLYAYISGIADCRGRV